MKKPILNYLSALFFILLFTACTQHDITLDPTQDEEVVTRSTQAECDSIQATWSSHNTPHEECLFIAELLQCRLNQGVDEAHVAANCIKVDGYSFFPPNCYKVSDILLNYPALVASFKQEVYQNTGGCPPAYCPGPITPEMCRTIIFTVSFNGDFCPDGKCDLKIDAVVYCCI